MKRAVVVSTILLQSAIFDAKAGGSEVISADEYGKEWPFTVTSGLLRCVDPGAVTFAANGKAYGVNGLAVSDPRNEDLREIWKDDTESEVAQYWLKKGRPDLISKISIGPIISRGLKLCQ